MEYNEAHGITPATIHKEVRDVLEISTKAEEPGKKPKKRLSAQEKNELIKKMTAEMKKAAKLLEFEQAAFLRDEIEKLKKM